MKKENKIFLIIIIGLLITAIFASIITKKSFIKTSINEIIRDESHIDFSFSGSENININQTEKLNNLIMESDLIVNVSLDNTKDKDIMQYATLGDYKINKVYKGKEKENNIVKIYEKIFVNSYYDESEYNKKPHFGIVAESGHNFMKESSEYILFLKSTQNPIAGDKSNTYIMVDDFYGAYKINDQVKSKVIEEGEDYNYIDLLKEDIFVRSEETKDIYENFRMEVINRYGL